MSWFNKLDEVVGRAFHEEEENNDEVDSDEEFISIYQQQQKEEKHRQRQRQQKPSRAQHPPNLESTTIQCGTGEQQSSGPLSQEMERYNNFDALGEEQSNKIQSNINRQHPLPPLDPENSMLKDSEEGDSSRRINNISQAENTKVPNLTSEESTLLIYEVENRNTGLRENRPEGDSRIPSVSQICSASGEVTRETQTTIGDRANCRNSSLPNIVVGGRKDENDSISQNSSSLSSKGEDDNAAADVWMENDPDDIDSLDLAVDSSLPPKVLDAPSPVDGDGKENNVIHGTSIDENSTNDGSERDLRSRSMTGEFSNMSIDVSTHASSFDDELDDYNVQLPLQSWDEDAYNPWNPSMNCHGVVHVRIVRAQNLPCSVGSHITANVSLPPWKGRVRSDHTIAYLGPSGCGVCVRWDPLDDDGIHSMVHAWNNASTPIPDIFVELMFHPLPMMEFQVCSVEVSCRPLMRSPGTWLRRWVQTELPKNPLEPTDPSTPQVKPLLLLEAVFVPDTMNPERVGTISNADNRAIQLEEETDSIGEMINLPHESAKSIGTPSVVSSLRTLRNPTKMHLLSKRSFFVPAVCSVCSDLITGWKRAYRCERCKIDCCLNCQLQVDLQIPCESDSATAAFNKAIQNTNVLQIIAPPDPSYQEESKLPPHDEANAESKQNKTVRFPISERFDSTTNEKQIGIGRLRLNIIRACVFERPFPPEVDPAYVFDQTESRSLRHGDHYVRISWTGSKEKTRTKTVQNTATPHFDSEEMTFEATHYGMEYQIELVDDITNKSVGSTLLRTQTLLQQQRDLLVDRFGSSSILSLEQLNHRVEKRRVILELRSGVKSGFGPDYFNASKKKEQQTKQEDKRRSCEVSGWLEVDVCFEEELNELYGLNPLECPPAPPDDLNLDLFSIHIGRISAIINDIKKGFKGYAYLVSWEDPALTSLSLIIFIMVCLRFNAEYFASIPVFFLIIYMARLSLIRRSGDLKKRFINKERDACIEAEKKVMIKHSVHRPIGHVEINLFKGKNIRSRELGLTGSCGCRIYYDPLRHQSNYVNKDSLIALDKSLDKVHDIAYTNYQLSTDPVWEISESDETKRLNQLLPNQCSLFETDGKPVRNDPKNASTAIQFPLLQPVVPTTKQDASGGARLSDWVISPGAIVFQVRFHDMLNNLAGFYDDLGEVCIPISQLVKEGEVSGWFDVQDVGTKTMVCSNVHSAKKSRGDNSRSDLDIAATIEKNPQIYLQARWYPPDVIEHATETAREASVVVAEEMIRSTMTAAEDSKGNLIGSSIGAFNTVSALGKQVQMIQNILGNVLDIIEKIRNLFNFTDPLKSTALLLMLVVLWIFLALVPTRAMILIGGLGQYTATFVARFGIRSSSANKDEKGLDSKEKGFEMTKKSKPPIITWLINAFRALPTDEDLRRTYFWESRRVAECERNKFATEKRVARLQRLWKAEWYACVHLKVPCKKGSSEHRGWEWISVFSLVHGRRFMWWQNESDFDNGEAPAGRIYFSGHAGLAGLSPLDLRELNSEEIPLVVSIFGRGIEDQQKIMLLTPSIQVKENLENSILAATVSEKGD